MIASMADENARHHNMPAASNHTLPVHAIQYDGEQTHRVATTFLAFHPCSNYGGQNFLSASGTGCSSEATGRLSGIAGLRLLGGAAGRTCRSRPGEAARSSSRRRGRHRRPRVARGPTPLPVVAARLRSALRLRPRERQPRGRGGPRTRNPARGRHRRRRAGSPCSTRTRLDGPVDIVGTVSRAARATLTTTWSSGRPACSRSTASSRSSRKMQNIAPDDGHRRDGAARVARRPRRSRSTSTSRDPDSPLRRERLHDHGARARRRALRRRRSATCAARCAAPTTCTTIPTLVKGFPIYLGDSGESSAEDRRHRRRRRARHRLPDRGRRAVHVLQHDASRGRRSSPASRSDQRGRRPRRSRRRPRARRSTSRRRPTAYAAASTRISAASRSLNAPGDRRPRRRRQDRRSSFATWAGTIYVDRRGRRAEAGLAASACPRCRRARSIRRRPEPARAWTERRASRAARSRRRCSPT